jgi:hypothetical protein
MYSMKFQLFTCEKDHFVSGFVADPLLLWKLKYESLSNCQQSYYRNIGYFGEIYTCEFFFQADRCLVWVVLEFLYGTEDQLSLTIRNES